MPISARQQTPQRTERLDTFWKAAKAFAQVATSIQCAGIAFFAFLSIFPVLIFLVTMVGLFGPASTVGEFIAGLKFVAPDSALSLLTKRVETVLPQSEETLGLGLVASAVTALWSGSRAVRGLFFALSQVRPGRRRRRFFKRLLTSAVFLLIGASFLLAGLLATSSATLTMGASPGMIWLRWPVMLFGAFVGFYALYRWGPETHPTSATHIVPGAAMGAVLWVVVSFLLSLYTEHVGSIEETFGSVASTVVLLLWLYFSARACIIGAILNVLIEEKTSRSRDRSLRNYPHRPSTGGLDAIDPLRR